MAKSLDGVDIPAILTMFMFILDHMKLNPERFPSSCRRFLEEPIAVVVYPTNCLEEEQVRGCAFGDVVTL